MESYKRAMTGASPPPRSPLWTAGALGVTDGSARAAALPALRAPGLPDGSPPPDVPIGAAVLASARRRSGAPFCAYDGVERRGRPGKDTRYRRIEHHHFSLEVSVDHDAVAFDAASDGCFPFITNDDDLTPAELLGIYKAQPHLERRHATFKGVIEAAPLTLKSDARIDALAFCLYVALLVHALVDRELRQAMATKDIEALPLYYEDRACTAPTAAPVFELLDPLCLTTVTHAGELLTVIPPTLDALQRQLLSLLKVPTSAYDPTRRRARYSR